VGQALSFTSDAVPGRTFEGKVAFINPSADPVSRAVKVVAEVPNPDGALKAELFVRGRIATGSHEAVLQVPRAALLSWDLQAGTAELFVAGAGVARRRAVKTGASAGEQVEVREGLAAGEKVVTRGAFNLKDGDKVSVQGN
jgi:RND family efflux transporter MFP subunit